MMANRATAVPRLGPDSLHIERPSATCCGKRSCGNSPESGASRIAATDDDLSQHPAVSCRAGESFGSAESWHDERLFGQSGSEPKQTTPK